MTKSTPSKTPIKRETNPNLVRKSFLVHRVQQNMLDELLSRWGFINESEVIRQAITVFYRKYEPEYLKPSVNQQEKLKQVEEREKMAAMTDEDYVKDIIRGEVLTAASGAKYCAIHFFGNSAKAIPLEEARDYFNKYPDDLEFHIAKLSEKPLMPVLKMNVIAAQLKRDFDIDL
jgi:hypothetical protein